jgi:hypothetical protein
MQEHEAVNKKVGEWYNSFEGSAAGLVEWSGQFISQDWFMFIAILLALILFAVMGLRNT